MRAIELQQSFLLGAGDFVNRLHKGSPKWRIYMAQNTQNLEPGAKSWVQRGYNLPDAIRQAQAWETMGAADCYAAANGSSWAKGSGRTVSAVQSINGFYIDFDRYKVEAYSSLSASDFVKKVLDDNPWLPSPTVYEDSGNGCWMFWTFSRPLHISPKCDWLQQWQACQDFLVKKLRPYGADPACSDAARVVRLSGTVNTKTLRTAQAWETGESYTFAQIKAAITAESLKDSRRHNQSPAKPLQSPQGSKVSSLSKLPKLFNLYSLAHARMQDIKQLAVLRGGRLSEHRRMATWICAVSAAHYCRSEDTLRAEVGEFIGQYIEGPDKYLKAINYQSTVDRFNAELQLIQSGVNRKQVRLQLGIEKAQYILSNRYILSQLEITQEEQRKLKTIIGEDEKQRRHCIAERKRRRAAGAEDRQDYLARSSQRQEQAQQLYKQGMSLRAIARQTGFSLSSVKAYTAALRSV